MVGKFDPQLRIRYDQAAQELIPLIGEHGVNALAERSLFDPAGISMAHSQGRDYAGGVSYRPGAFAIWKGRHPRSPSAAGTALIVTFSELLSTCVGVPLTNHLLRQAWHGAAERRSRGELHLTPRVRFRSPNGSAPSRCSRRRCACAKRRSLAGAGDPHREDVSRRAGGDQAGHGSDARGERASGRHDGSGANSVRPGGAGQSSQGRVPGRGVARAENAAQRGARMGAHAARKGASAWTRHTRNSDHRAQRHVAGAHHRRSPRRVECWSRERFAWLPSRWM